MQALFQFLARYEFFVYFALGIGIVIALRGMAVAYGSMRAAVFGLERQLATRAFNSSLALVVVLSVLGLMQFCIASFIVPGRPSAFFRLTPTADVLSTPEGTLPPQLATALAETPAGNDLPFGAQGCIPGQIVISSPVAGSDVSGIVDIVGTVDIPDFGFYKYEVAPLGSSNWATVSAGREPVRNDLLGRWDTTALTPGDFQLRLVVSDNQGQQEPPCIVVLRVIPSTPGP
jgi:hypothetical protein